MKYKLFINDQFAGESDLEYPDEGMNVYQGRFVASSDYWRWQPVFRSFADEKLCARFFEEKAKLHFKLVREDGAVCEGGHKIHIDDFSEESGDDAITLTLWQPRWKLTRRYAAGKNVIEELQKIMSKSGIVQKLIKTHNLF